MANTAKQEVSNFTVSFKNTVKRYEGLNAGKKADFARAQKKAKTYTVKSEIKREGAQ